MLDCGAVRLYATEALSLAESLQRDDLVADAMSWTAGVLNAEGDAPGAAEMDRQAPWLGSVVRKPSGSRAR